MSKSKKDVKKGAEAPHRHIVDLSYNHEYYSRVSKHAARMHYWMVLLVLVITKFLLFAVLIPYILILESAFLILILGIIGFVFGMIFNFLINDIEHLESKHHRFAVGFIPMIAILNIYILISIQRVLTGYFPYSDNIFFYGSAIYVAMFLLPYITGVLHSKRA